MTNQQLHPDASYVRMGEPPTLNGNTLHGYAAVFNQPTKINSWEGQFTEIIRPGAFTRTIQNRGDQIKALFDHGLDPAVGNRPLGKLSVLREDNHGLYYEVPLDDTSYNRDLKESLKSGAIDSSSFRFAVPKNGDRWEGDTRELLEVKLYEVSAVTFPAYEAATAGIRSSKAYEQWRAGRQLEPNITHLGGGNSYTFTIHAPNMTEEELVRSVRDTLTDPPPEALEKKFAQLARRAHIALRDSGGTQ